MPENALKKVVEDQNRYPIKEHRPGKRQNPLMPFDKKLLLRKHQENAAKAFLASSDKPGAWESATKTYSDFLMRTFVIPGHMTTKDAQRALEEAQSDAQALGVEGKRRVGESQSLEEKRRKRKLSL